MNFRPKLSIIVVIFNMQREALRTLYSLSTDYQIGVESKDYEVIVIENGSTAPLSKSQVLSLGNSFSYINLRDESHPSPARALNKGINIAKGTNLAFIIDGARIVTPGIVRMALLGLNIYPRTIIATLSWHLGPDIQMRSIHHGYCKEIEDKLLNDIKWKKNGYNLYEISTLAASSSNGYFSPISESNVLFMPKKLALELKGFDERFDMPGGGLLNLDFYYRSCSLPDTELVILLGEGSFHQVHGGIASNSLNNEYIRMAFNQYFFIHNRKYLVPNKDPIYIGMIPEQSLKFFALSISRKKAVNPNTN